MSSALPWGAARASWEANLASNPSNDAAWYNLGVAVEVAGNYSEAAKNYQRALQLKDNSMYRKALDRLKRRKQEYHKYEEQIRGR